MCIWLQSARHVVGRIRNKLKIDRSLYQGQRFGAHGDHRQHL